MTTIVINEKTKKGRIILDLIREMGVGEIIESKKVSFIDRDFQRVK